MEINIPNVLVYTDQDKKERTEQRLKEIIGLGMTEVGYGQYGIKGLMSGLYIEMVWSFSEKDWTQYMDWVKELKKVKQNKF
jgi:hypothetical protein